MDTHVVPVSAMRTRSQMAERNLPYAKVVPVSAMRTRSQMAERSLPYAKVVNTRRICAKKQENKSLPPIIIGICLAGKD